MAPKYSFKSARFVQVSVSEAQAWTPAMDVYETEDRYVVRLEIPGVAKQDLKLGFGDNTLTIRGERRGEEPGPKVTFLRMEIGYGEFRREVNFPKPIRREAIQAQYREGFLKVVLPKHERANEA